MQALNPLRALNVLSWHTNLKSAPHVEDLPANLAGVIFKRRNFATYANQNYSQMCTFWLTKY